MPAKRADFASEPQHFCRNSPFTMPFAWSGATARLAGRDGFDAAPMLRDAGLLAITTPITATSPLDPAGFLITALALINAFDDELHGIAPGRMARGTASMAARAMASARNLHGAIDTLVRFLEVVGGRCRIDLRRSAHFARIEVRVECVDPTLQSIMEEYFAHFVHQQLSYCVGFRLPLAQFVTTSAHHPSLGGVHPYLLCPVRRERITSFAFAVEYLSRSRRILRGNAPISDALMLWLLQHPASGTAAPAMVDPSSLTAKVYASLRQRDAGVAECASLVALSPVEFARALAQEATTYRSLRRAALIERSLPHLRAGIHVDELAELLGYADGRSCRRALKLACGLTIDDLRQATDRIARPMSAAASQAVRKQAAGLQ